MAEPILPIIHLNGTSARELIEQREQVYTALTKAMDAFREMSPNARDYYPVGGLYEKAVAQHERRTGLLKALQEEIEAEVGHLDAIEMERKYPTIPRGGK